MDGIKELTKTIKSHQAYLDLDNKKVAMYLGKSDKTIGRYVNDPSTMTVGDFRVLIKLLELDDNTVINGLCR